MEWNTKVLLLFLTNTLFTLINQCGSADVFASLERLRALMEFERELPDILGKYIEKETQRLEQMKMIQMSMEESIPEDYEDTVNKDIVHPSATINTMERFVNGWQPLLAVASNFTTFLEMKGKVQDRFNDLVPLDDDLRGAYYSFVRLQEVYHLETTDLIQGKIRHQVSDYRMDASDCYSLAQASLQRWQYNTAIQWLDQGLELVSEGPLWEQMARLIGELIMKVKGPEGPPPAPEKVSWRADYEALCRGEKIKKLTSPDLYCTYKGHGIPYAPWKEEILNRKPYMSMFHDFITDKENSQIREEAFPTLSRARVGGQDDSHVSEVRVGKVAWLYTHLSPFSRKLTIRTEDATGLDCLNYAESYQIGNYGMGGHYEPHQDSDPIRFTNANIEGKVMGDRIATLMIYLSDVTAGGGTAFPHLGLAVKPIKNAAIFWYNLKRNGELYQESLHGACPVLLGNKWVANKWIHELGQVFKRPCSLSPDE